MLLNSIQYPGSINFTTHSVNTVGTNIYTLHNEIAKATKKSAKKSITIRELGGEMAVMWKNYYTESVEKIMFVVDTSNLCQISCAGRKYFLFLSSSYNYNFVFESQTLSFRRLVVLDLGGTETAKGQNMSSADENGLCVSTNEE